MTTKANSDMGTDIDTEPYSSLWLDYQPLSESRRTDCDRVQYVYCGGNGAVLSNPRDALLTALQAIIGPEIALKYVPSRPDLNGTLWGPDLNGTHLGVKKRPHTRSILFAQVLLDECVGF